jgi:hypothetical protein
LADAKAEPEHDSLFGYGAGRILEAYRVENGEYVGKGAAVAAVERRDERKRIRVVAVTRRGTERGEKTEKKKEREIGRCC